MSENPGRFLLVLSLLLLPLLLCGEDGASKLTPLFRLPTGGRIQGRPLEDSEARIVFASEDRYLYRIGRDGRILRRDDLPGLPDTFASLGADDTVYISLKGGRLAAVNSRGSLLWQRRFSGPLCTDPLVGGDGSLYVVDASGMLTALNHRGETLWEEELAGGCGGQPVIDSRGVLMVPDGAGFLNAWLPWGRRLWRFRLAGPMSAVFVGADAVYTASTEGTVASVSPEGRLNWSRYLGGRLTLLAEDGDALYGIGPSGNMTIISLQGEIRIQRKLAVTEPAALFRTERGLTLAEAAGRIRLVDLQGRVLEERVLPGPVERPGLVSGGLLLGGGADWNLYSLGGPPRVESAWSGPGGEPGNRWNRQFIGRAGVFAPWIKDPDYLLLSALLEREGELSRREALEVLREKLTFPEGRRRSPPFYREFAVRIATELFDRPLVEEGRVLNDYPDLRFAAVELLGNEASYASREALQLVLEKEWALDTRIVAMRGLGRIGSDPDGRSTRAVARAVLGHRPIDTEAVLTRAAMKALLEILEYHGSAPDRMLYDAAIEVYKRSQDRESRRLALALLRY
jgi:PQQ-like domain